MTVPASGDDPARTPVVPQTEPSGPQLWLNVVDVFHIFSRGTVRGQVPRGMTVEFVPKASHADRRPVWSR